MEKEKLFTDFAKIFETDHGQVLVTKEFDEEEESFKIVAKCHLDGMEMTMALGSEEEEKTDAIFNERAEEFAKSFAERMLGLAGKEVLKS